MKNSLILFTAAMLATLAAQSCKKDIVPLDAESPKTVEVSFSMNSALEVKSHESASMTDTNERKINTVQFFVFNGTMLEAYGRATTPTITLTLTTGTKQVYAFANCDDFSAYTTIDALKAVMIDLADNRPTNLMMFGTKTVSVSDDSPIVVDVRRYVSRVVVKQINRNFQTSSIASQEFKISKIYLTNVAGTIDLAGTAAPTVWYNLGGNKNEVPALLQDSPNAVLLNNNSHQTTYFYYCFPNNGEDKTTRLVIEATIGGNVTYYPVDLPVLESNKSYEFNQINIMRPGSDSPDVPVTKNVISFSLNVIDWERNIVQELVI